MGLSLWSIDEKLEALIHEATDRDTGEINEDALNEIDQLEMDKTAKLLGCAAYLKGELAEAAAVQTVADGLLARVRSHEARAARMRKYMLRHLTPGEEVKDARIRLHWTKSSAVEITDEKAIPAQFMVQPPRPDSRPDKKAIKAGLKTAGVSGARMEHRQTLKID